MGCRHPSFQVTSSCPARWRPARGRTGSRRSCRGPIPRSRTGTRAGGPWPPVRLTQNSAGLSWQWMHSWMVCGSRAGGTRVRSVSRGGCGRAPTRGFEAVMVRAGAGSGVVVQRSGPGRVAATASGPAARRASMRARLVSLAGIGRRRWTWFMRASADFPAFLCGDGVTGMADDALLWLIWNSSRAGFAVRPSRAAACADRSGCGTGLLHTAPVSRLPGPNRIWLASSVDGSGSFDHLLPGQRCQRL
jgi:hypothetical protein